MKIDRWNMNTLRRYHLDNGAIICVTRDVHGRRCTIIPASASYISVPIDPRVAALMINAHRIQEGAGHAV